MDIDRHWYAFYTRARHERRVEERFRQLGFETFLPCILRQRQWKDRKKTIAWPLFPGYLFLRCGAQEVSRLAGTTGVVGTVSANGKPAMVNAAELDNVRLLVQALPATEASLERASLEPGDAVRVTDGPLKGIEGVVVQQRSGRKFMVHLTTIGAGLVVNVDDRLLEARSGR